MIATYLRLWGLTEFPPSVTGDESRNGVDLIELVAHPHLTPFFPANTGREALFFYLVAPWFVILGPTLFALRIIPVFNGILLVALTYRWTRQLLPQLPWVAVITAIFIATSPWGLYNSRIGLRGSLLPTFMLATYISFWHGINRLDSKNPTLWFIITGLFLGLTSYTYTSSRLLPITFILFALWMRSSKIWRGVVIIGIVSFIVFIPLGWYFIQHPNAFLARTLQVSLLNEPNITGYWFDNLYLFINLTTPWIQNDDWNILWQWLPLIFWLGILPLIFLSWQQPAYAFLLISFIVGLLPALWSFPTTLRISPALPQTFLILALGVHIGLGRSIKFLNPYKFIIVLLILLISTLSALNLFRFERWVVGFPNTPNDERWVYLAHLPTLYDHALGVATQEIKTLVLQQKQPLLIPQTLYERIYTPLRLYPDFKVTANPAKIAPQETVFILWSLEFEQQPGQFVLLSPTGQIEPFGQWKAESRNKFKQLVNERQFYTTTIHIVDKQQKSIGFIVPVDWTQISPYFDK